MTDSNYTHIALVADRSGSMSMIREDAEGAINEFLREQKKVPGRATLTFVQFDDEYEVVHENVDLQGVPAYNLRPRGVTALLDAVGRTINNVGERLAGLTEDERPGTVVFVIVTDGMENASTEFNWDQVKESIERQTNDYAWRFVFLAANQDAIQTGGNLGIAKGSSITYGANAKGTRSVFAAASSLVTAYRGGDLDAQFDSNDREEALGTEK